MAASAVDPTGTLRPGAYEYEPLDGLDSDTMAAYKRLDRDRVRFITNDGTEYGVQVDTNGMLEVRCVEGRLLIAFDTANRITIRTELE